jgi:GNAT superfamily N-acetyltransferase
MERLDEIVILPAGPGDAAALAEVHVRSWRETYKGILPDAYLDGLSVPGHARRWRHQLMQARPECVVIVAEGPAGLVGYCAGSILPGAPGGVEAEVHTLYLLRSAQSMGNGRRLLGAAARVLEAQGAGSLVIWVLSANRKARRFYDHIGGVAAAERPVRGWGGHLQETAYVWSSIAAVGAY